MSEQDRWLSRWDQAMMHTFDTPARVFVQGNGAELTDIEGRHYVDMFSGIAVGGLGHAHPAVIKAVSSQIATLGHISNLFASVPQITLAERLDSLVVPSGQVATRVYFANSGTEANEAAFKISRLTGRTRVVAMTGSFHGRTMGALALTATEKYRQPFEPLPDQVDFVPFGDLEALAGAMDERVAAVVCETIQGESGVIPAPEGFLAGARRLCDQHGALLWVDEVQTGIGRCGEWFTSIADGVLPDLITLAKGLGNGIPIGATIATGPAADLLTPGSHGSTFAGNPVACAAGLAVLTTITDQGLLQRACDLGERLVAAVTGLDNPLVEQVRGRGLLRAIQLTRDIAPAVVGELLDAGWIVNAPRPSVIRLAPPLVISADQVDGFVDALDATLKGHAHG